MAGPSGVVKGTSTESPADGSGRPMLTSAAMSSEKRRKVAFPVLLFLIAASGLRLRAQEPVALLSLPLRDRSQRIERQEELDGLIRQVDQAKAFAESEPEGEFRTAVLDALGRQRTALLRVQQALRGIARRQEVLAQLAEAGGRLDAELPAKRAEVAALRERRARGEASAPESASSLEELRQALGRLQERGQSIAASLAEVRSAKSQAETALAALNENIGRRRTEGEALAGRAEAEFREAIAAESAGKPRQELYPLRERAYAMRLEQMAQGLELAQDEWRLKDELPLRIRVAERDLLVHGERQTIVDLEAEALRQLIDEAARREAEERSSSRAYFRERLDSGEEAESHPRFQVELKILDAKERLDWAEQAVITWGNPLPPLVDPIAVDRLSLDAARLRTLYAAEARRLETLRQDQQQIRDSLTQAREDRVRFYEARGEIDEFISARRGEMEDVAREMSPFRRAQLRERFEGAARRFEAILGRWDAALSSLDSNLKSKFEAIDQRLAAREGHLGVLRRRLLWLQDESQMSLESLRLAFADTIRIPAQAKRLAIETATGWWSVLADPASRIRTVLLAAAALLAAAGALVLRKRIPAGGELLKRRNGIETPLGILILGLRGSVFLSAAAVAYLLGCAIYGVVPWETGILSILVISPFVYRFLRVLLDLLFRPGANSGRLLHFDDSLVAELHRTLLWILRIFAIFTPAGLLLHIFGYTERNPGFMQSLWFAQTICLSIALLVGVTRPSVIRRIIRGKGQVAASARALMVVLYPIILGAVFFLLYLNGFRYQQAVAFFRERFLYTILLIVVGFSVYRWLLRRLLPDRDFYRIVRREDFDDDASHVAAGARLFYDRFFRLGLRLAVAIPGVIILFGIWSEVELAFMSKPFTATGNLTPNKLIWGIIVIFITATVVRHYRRAMQFVFLPSLEWDKGLQYAVVTLTSYFLFAVGIVICLNLIQVQGDQIAFVLSALMVGIGFGLKDIVTNFVSGLILLIERPLKVGDQVEIGTNIGVVETINLRSTTIMTFDNIGVVVPNADLVAQTLVNRSCGNPTVRSKIVVGISYGADVRLVTRILQEAVEGHGLVLKKPPPAVHFTEFGDSSLEFSVTYWSRIMDNRLKINSDLRSAFLSTLRKHGVEIPFPQRDLHLRSAEPVLEMLKRVETRDARPGGREAPDGADGGPPAAPKGQDA